MSKIQEPPVQRPFTVEVGGQTLVDPIWAKWLFDLAPYLNTLNASGAGLPAVFYTTPVSLSNGAGAALGTLANAPTAGNPTKWIGINDNGTTRYIPAW